MDGIGDFLAVREFTEMIFLGNAAAAEKKKRIHELLDNAFSCMVQQPPHSPTEKIARIVALQDAEAWFQVHTIARDIVMALTGKEITFEDEVQV